WWVSGQRLPECVSRRWLTLRDIDRSETVYWAVRARHLQPRRHRPVRVAGRPTECRPGPRLDSLGHRRGRSPACRHPQTLSGGGRWSVLTVSTRLEVAGDIEVVASMAPGATITPFMAANIGGTDSTNAILNAMATQVPLSLQISTSWNTDADDNTVHALQQLAA